MLFVVQRLSEESISEAIAVDVNIEVIVVGRHCELGPESPRTSVLAET